MPLYTPIGGSWPEYWPSRCSASSCAGRSRVSIPKTPRKLSTGSSKRWLAGTRIRPLSSGMASVADDASALVCIDSVGQEPPCGFATQLPVDPLVDAFLGKPLPIWLLPSISCKLEEEKERIALALRKEVSDQGQQGFHFKRLLKHVNEIIRCHTFSPASRRIFSSPLRRIRPFYDTERERNCDFQLSHVHRWFPIPLGEPEIESKVCHCRLFEKCKVRWSGYSDSASLSRINGV
jgi:hypothetical protein